MPEFIARQNENINTGSGVEQPWLTLIFDLLPRRRGDAARHQQWASFCAAIRIAKEQKSVSLEKRAEASYAEYRGQKGKH